MESHTKVFVYTKGVHQFVKLVWWKVHSSICIIVLKSPIIKYFVVLLSFHFKVDQMAQTVCFMWHTVFWKYIMIFFKCKILAFKISFCILCDSFFYLNLKDTLLLNHHFTIDLHSAIWVQTDFLGHHQKSETNQRLIDPNLIMAKWIIPYGQFR